MAVYKVSDLLTQAQELTNDGYEYVEITELEPDEDAPACLCFEAVVEETYSVDFDSIDACEVPKDYIKPHYYD